MEFREVNVGREGILLMPISDVQLGASGCDEERFERHIRWGAEQGAWFVGLGDYIDLLSPTNRHIAKGLYDVGQDAIREAAEVCVRRFLDITESTKGRWLGVLQGHHYYELDRGQTTDTVIASALGTAFLGDCAIVRVRFSAVAFVDVYIHHGVSNSPLVSLDKARRGHMADIYLAAHAHKKVSEVIDQCYFTSAGEQRHRTIVLASTGGFLRGYLAGHKRDGRPQGNYIEKRMLPPVALGGIVLKLTPKHEEGRVDVEVSL